MNYIVLVWNEIKDKNRFFYRLKFFYEHSLGFNYRMTDKKFLSYISFFFKITKKIVLFSKEIKNNNYSEIVFFLLIKLYYHLKFILFIQNIKKITKITS